MKADAPSIHELDVVSNGDAVVKAVMVVDVWVLKAIFKRCTEVTEAVERMRKI